MSNNLKELHSQYAVHHINPSNYLISYYFEQNICIVWFQMSFWTRGRNRVRFGHSKNGMEFWIYAFRVETFGPKRPRSEISWILSVPESTLGPISPKTTHVNVFTYSQCILNESCHPFLNIQNILKIVVLMNVIRSNILKNCVTFHILRQISWAYCIHYNNNFENILKWVTAPI